MTIRNLSPNTQQAYIRTIKNRTTRPTPGYGDFPDVGRFQLYTAASDVGAGALDATAAALRLFLRATLGRPNIIKYTTFVREPSNLRVVIGQQEVALPIDAAPALKCNAALNISLRAGLRASVHPVAANAMIARMRAGQRLHLPYLTASTREQRHRSGFAVTADVSRAHSTSSGRLFVGAAPLKPDR